MPKDIIQLYAEVTAAFSWTISELENRPFDELYWLWQEAVEVLKAKAKTQP